MGFGRHVRRPASVCPPPSVAHRMRHHRRGSLSGGSPPVLLAFGLGLSFARAVPPPLGGLDPWPSPESVPLPG